MPLQARQGPVPPDPAAKEKPLSTLGTQHLTLADYSPLSRGGCSVRGGGDVGGGAAANCIQLPPQTNFAFGLHAPLAVSLWWRHGRHMPHPPPPVGRVWTRGKVCLRVFYLILCDFGFVQFPETSFGAQLFFFFFANVLCFALRWLCSHLWRPTPLLPLTARSASPASQDGLFFAVLGKGDDGAASVGSDDRSLPALAVG